MADCEKVETEKVETGKPNSSSKTKTVVIDISRNTEHDDNSITVLNLRFRNLTEQEIDKKVKKLAAKKCSEGSSDHQHNYFSALDEIRAQIKEEQHKSPYGFYDYCIMYDEILYQKSFPEGYVFCPIKGHQYSVKIVTLKCGHQYSFDGFRNWIKTFRPRGLKQCKKCRNVFTYDNFLKIIN